MHTDDSPTSPTMQGSAASRAIRASPLHRGEACLTCRRRKMKCDAGKPHCGPCSRAGKADECEYEETRFLAQITRLEDENARLQERIRELEGGFLGAQQQPQQFTAFLPGPGPGRRSPSDAGSSGGQPSPYGQSAPLLVHQHPPHPHMSPYHQHQQHAQYDQLPNIVTQPQPTQDWSSPGGLALQDAIQPHILQRLMHIFTRVASAQFGLPQASTALLAARRGAGALQEAACAAACVFARPNNGMAAYEAVFAQRAALALSRPTHSNNSELQDVQAGVILAVLAFVGGRALEAQRHLGGALRVARALRLEQADPDAERRETWWMLRRAERAWAPVVGEVDTPAPLGDYVKQEYSPYGVPVATPAVELDGRGAQLAAHAWALVGDAQSSTAGPNFWHDVHSTTSALERLASISSSSSPSTTVILHAAQCLLQAAVGARDKARACAMRVAAALGVGGEVESLDAVVGWWIVQVRASGAADDGALERAVERARAAWAYVGALRI